MQSDCVFCQRIESKQYDRLFKTHQVVTFEPLNPLTPGHLLVIPIKHVKDAAEIPYVTGQVMLCASQIAKEVGSCNIITSIGTEATQSIFHLHIHIVPRRPDDKLSLPWTGQKAK